jgi:pyruvate/2-oxoglutarate dehydrogenase complex dihydrolipoamide dehydrogenase (E3) component
VHRLAQGAAALGTIVGTPRLDWERVVARQHEIVGRLRPAPDKLEATGARVYLGEARFLDPHTLAVDGREIRGEHIIIAAGSAPIVLPLPGHELAITSDDLLFLPEFPRRLVLIGSGAIGLEMAGAYSDLGAETTVIGQEDEILAGFDAEVAVYLRTILEARGIVFHQRAQVTALSGRRGDITVHFTQDGAARTVRASDVCLAVGRRFDSRRLGAEDLGLEANRLGLATSRHLRTSVSHIYAAGDAAGNAQLTPAAAHEGQVAGRNAVKGDLAIADLSMVPQTVFTTPEIARVGLSHREAQARGIACHVTTHDMKGASNGVAMGEDSGYLKLVFEGSAERIVGVQMVSYAAGELIQLAALAVRLGTTADQLATQLAVHPSQAERFIKVAAHSYHEICAL